MSLLSLPDMDEATFGAIFRAHAGTSRQGAAFLSRIDHTKAGMREAEPLQHFVIRFEGIGCDFHEWARSRQEAIDNAKRVAVSNPNLRRSLIVERIEVPA